LCKNYSPSYSITADKRLGTYRGKNPQTVYKKKSQGVMVSSMGVCRY